MHVLKCTDDCAMCITFKKYLSMTPIFINHYNCSYKYNKYYSCFIIAYMSLLDLKVVQYNMLLLLIMALLSYQGIILYIAHR